MYLILMNPTSGRGAGLKLKEQIIAVLRERGYEYQIEIACGQPQIEEISDRLCHNTYEGVIAVGGDGTLFHTINHMRGNASPLIFVPCGTGNDFVKMLHLPKDPIEALKLQLDMPVSQIDYGQMNELAFLNVAGTGFDVDVLRDTEKYKDRYSGLRAYFHGLVDAVKTYRPMCARVSIDDGPEEEMRFAILSIGNGRYIGGGMKAVPYAIIDDGLFDISIVNPVKKWQILPLIVFFITGTHLKLGLGKSLRCKKIRVQCKDMVLNVDGELLKSDDVTFELQHHKLNVRIPK